MREAGAGREWSDAALSGSPRLATSPVPGEVVTTPLSRWFDFSAPARQRRGCGVGVAPPALGGATAG